MPKQGPCGHCGTHSTPLWRNGPKEMPILCNACGSRWRIRATLQDYLPHQHSHSSSSSFPRKNRLGQFISDSFTSRRMVTRNISKKRRYDMSLLENGILESSSADPWYCYRYSTDDDDDDDDDDYQGIECDGKCKIPSGRGKSRSSKPENVNNVYHLHSSKARTQEHGTMDKLERDLQNILQTQKGPSIDSHEDVLLYNVNSHFCSENEIGLGGVLLQPPGK